LNGYVAGHYYYRGRFYDPVTGRFLSQDPIGFEAGDTSFYRYVGNQPTSFIDPEGLERRRHIGFVYIAENPTLDQWYVGKADVLDKRLTMSHKHAEFLTHPDTRIQLKPITAECDPTKPTRRQRTRILLDAEQAELDAKGGKSSSKSLNGKNELTVPEKRDAVRSKFKPRTGKGGVVKAGKTAGKSTALNLRKPSGSRLGGTGGAGQEAFSLFVGVGFLLLDRKRINDEVFGGQATGSDLDHYQLTQSLLCEFLNLTEHDLKPGHFGGFYRNPFTSQWEKAGQSAVENLMLGSFPGQFWAYDRETNSLYTIGYDEWHEMHEYKER
jgi:hypothetical protein